MPYQRLLAELNELADDTYKSFHSRLLNNENIRVLGVKVPLLRKIAKNYSGKVDELLSFPDDYYEVTFIKLCAVANLKYVDFIPRVDGCVKLIDNWATCDCFAPKCIKSHRDDFLPYIGKFLGGGQAGEFSQRFALTSLLHFYVEERYFDDIFSAVKIADTNYYYVHMAAAWLIAEVITHNFEAGVAFLNSGALDKKTHNKAIQKACESYRIDADTKNFLRKLKR